MKFLLFDKEKRFYPIFGDILDITGHKLMVALDEKKAKDLLKAVSPDFLILRWKDRDFLGNCLKKATLLFLYFWWKIISRRKGLKNLALAISTY